MRLGILSVTCNATGLGKGTPFGAKGLDKAVWEMLGLTTGRALSGDGKRVVPFTDWTEGEGALVTSWKRGEGLGGRRGWLSQCRLASYIDWVGSGLAC